jgi:hypothetical protein
MNTLKLIKVKNFEIKKKIDCKKQVIENETNI